MDETFESDAKKPAPRAIHNKRRGGRRGRKLIRAMRIGSRRTNERPNPREVREGGEVVHFGEPVRARRQKLADFADTSLGTHIPVDSPTQKALVACAADLRAFAGIIGATEVEGKAQFAPGRTSPNAHRI